MFFNGLIVWSEFVLLVSWFGVIVLRGIVHVVDGSFELVLFLQKNSWGEIWQQV